ncbi:MAG TPA: hypothetical protein P5305_03740 [Rubrivivax sp.]|nr:hypothetical protein [Rubrivivax sp.]HRY86973.1 hypothetical protein [Rubrivivax sp.]
MSWGKVIAGTTQEEYTVELDYGEATRAAYAAAMQQVIAQLQAAQDALQPKLDQADSDETAALSVVTAAYEAAALAMNDLPPGSPGVDTAAWRHALKEYRELQATHEPLRRRRDTLKNAMDTARKRAAYWETLEVIETRKMYRADATPLAIGGYARLLSVPAETGKLLIAPAGASGLGAPGAFVDARLMSPEQAYFNVSILPGVQRHKPTHRTGAITGIDYDAGTCTVQLDDLHSSQQRLPVNGDSTLHDVPVKYMTCDARGFGTDDRVVVEFSNQDWGSPKVVGYTAEPRKCPPKQVYETWPYITYFHRWRTMSAYPADFNYGEPPLRYELIEGQLPPGVTLNEDTGEMTGRSMEPWDSTIKIRCSDKYYVAGKNKRYDDTPPMRVIGECAGEFSSWEGMYAYAQNWSGYSAVIAISIEQNPDGTAVARVSIDDSYNNQSIELPNPNFLIIGKDLDKVGAPFGYWRKLEYASTHPTLLVPIQPGLGAVPAGLVYSGSGIGFIFKVEWSGSLPPRGHAQLSFSLEISVDDNGAPGEVVSRIAGELRLWTIGAGDP